MTVTRWTLIGLDGDDLTTTVAVIGPAGPTGATGPQVYGAVGDGATNDSASFNEGITDVRNLVGSAGSSYAIKDIALSNSESFLGNGTIVLAYVGATNIFVLEDYNPRLADFYISDNTDSAEAAINIGESRYADISGVISPASGEGFVSIEPADPLTTFTALASITNCTAEAISGVGVYIGSSVVETRAVHLFMAGALVAGTGGDKPTPGSIGWHQNTPSVGGFATGGHQLSNSAFLTFQTGMHLTDAQLSKYNAINIDSCSGYGLKVEGASEYLTFDGLFVGSTQGIYIGGSSSVAISGLETVLNGTIPPWGADDFYDGTAYDLVLADTAEVLVTGWKGDKRIVVASGAKLIVNDGMLFCGRSIANVAAGTPVYLAEQGHTANVTEALWRAPYDGYLVRISATPNDAPGSGKDFIYTAQINGSDTALTQTLSGAADFGGRDTWAASHISVSKGQYITITMASTAGATACLHWCEVQIVPR